MILAIAQDWGMFYAAWFAESPAAEAVSEEDRKAAADAVYLALTVMGHFYASDGDPRYAERMPASDSVIEEMRADIDYLSRNRRTQVPTLERLEVRSIEALDGDRLEIGTRESWTIRILWADSEVEAEAPRSQIVHCRYLMVRRTGGWQVVAWDLIEPEAGGGSDAT